MDGLWHCFNHTIVIDTRWWSQPIEKLSIESIKPGLSLHVSFGAPRWTCLWKSSNRKAPLVSTIFMGTVNHGKSHVSWWIGFQFCLHQCLMLNPSYQPNHGINLWSSTKKKILLLVVVFWSIYRKSKKDKLKYHLVIALLWYYHGIWWYYGGNWTTILFYTHSWQSHYDIMMLLTPTSKDLP